ncbi:histidine kinase [Amycolatopsis taiwanensis]|uniref:histidine kinase n=1 Tax=Amycolatopsis taiwanensis TaxID=342230 RepID=UPI0004B20BA0|nr:histidine kinase [Amycolatopsis taiwanensis]
MPAPRPLRPFVARATYRRWTHLALGAALAVPYFAVGWALGEILHAMAIGESRSWPGRWRTSLWFVLHLGAGMVIGTLTLVVPPLIVLLVAPLLTEPAGMFTDTAINTLLGVDTPWSPLAGIALTAAGFYLVAGAGAMLARAAPRLLGPSAADRPAEAQRRVRELSERNRIAAELHDSVGHALSVVTLPASAAAQELDHDPEFTRRALTVIEESSRAALNDLDGALATLRHEGADSGRPGWPRRPVRAVPLGRQV